MSDNHTHDLAPIWERLDRHGDKIQSLEVHKELSLKMLSDHSAELVRVNETIAKKHTQIMQGINDLTKSVDTIQKDSHIAIGAEQERKKQGARFRWAVGTLISIIGVLIAYVALSQGQ